MDKHYSKNVEILKEQKQQIWNNDFEDEGLKLDQRKSTERSIKVKAVNI